MNNKERLVAKIKDERFSRFRFPNREAGTISFYASCLDDTIAQSEDEAINSAECVRELCKLTGSFNEDKAFYKIKPQEGSSYKCTMYFRLSTSEESKTVSYIGVGDTPEESLRVARSVYDYYYYRYLKEYSK
jgi:hypothetical protein